MLQREMRGFVGRSFSQQRTWNMQLSFSSQYMAFFEFNNRLEAILTKAYIYR